MVRPTVGVSASSNPGEGLRENGSSQVQDQARHRREGADRAGRPQSKHWLAVHADRANVLARAGYSMPAPRLRCAAER